MHNDHRGNGGLGRALYLAEWATSPLWHVRTPFCGFHSFPGEKWSNGLRGTMLQRELQSPGQTFSFAQCTMKALRDALLILYSISIKCTQFAFWNKPDNFELPIVKFLVELKKIKLFHWANNSLEKRIISIIFSSANISLKIHVFKHTKSRHLPYFQLKS